MKYDKMKSNHRKFTISYEMNDISGCKGKQIIGEWLILCKKRDCG